MTSTFSPLQLDKMYDANSTEDDMIERFEEMNRMREHVMNEVDVDKDGMVSMDEFLKSTKSEEFKNNEPWQVGTTMMMVMMMIGEMIVNGC